MTETRQRTIWLINSDPTTTVFTFKNSIYAICKLIFKPPFYHLLFGFSVKSQKPILLKHTLIYALNKNQFLLKLFLESCMLYLHKKTFWTAWSLCREINMVHMFDGYYFYWLKEFDSCLSVHVTFSSLTLKSALKQSWSFPHWSHTCIIYDFRMCDWTPCLFVWSAERKQQKLTSISNSLLATVGRTDCRPTELSD